MPTFVKFWGHILVPACAAKLFGAKNNAANSSPGFTQDYSAVWSDYPAFALSQPPAPVGQQTAVAYLDGHVYNNPKKMGPGLNNFKPKKDRVPSDPILVAANRPVFDIVVEPEYIPDPFPVPYPYPVEEDFHDDLYISMNSPNNTVVPPPAPAETEEEDAPGWRKKKPRYKRTNYIERSDPQWVCPKDYFEEARKCVKFDVLDVEVGCADGWDFRNAECFAIDIQLPELVCPEGFEKVGLSCERTTIAPKQMICPENQFQTVLGCKQKVVAAPVPQCVGAAIQDGVCMRTKRLRPDPRCPDGFGLGADQRSCFKDAVIGGFQTCGAGFVLDESTGLCEKIVTTDPISSCPFGYSKEDHTCYKKILHPMIKTCDYGILTEDGSCVSTKSLGKPNLTCPHGAVLNAHMKCEVVIKSQSHKNKKKKEPCEHGHHLLGDECIKTVTTDPNYTCDDPDSKLVGHECVVSLASIPNIACPAGQILDGDSCYLNEATTVTTSCAIGFDLTLDSRCAKREVVNPQLACTAGYKPGPDSMCHQIEKIEATLICPASTELKMDSESGFTDYVCYGVESTDPHLTCPVPGLELESTSDGMKCTGWQLNEPKFTCAAGFTDDGGRCIKIESTLKHPVCPAEYSFSFDSCIKELRQPALYFCPDGYVHQKKSRTCSSKKFTELMPLCPEDMEFDALVGECYRMNSEIAFDEKEKDLNVTPTPPVEDLKDLNVPTSTTTTTTLAPVRNYDFDRLPYQRPFYDEPPAVQAAAIPAPQLTIVQQPVVVPQPAVILPQQAPVPPPTAIRVPYAVPQPVMTPVRPLEHHQHHAQQTIKNIYPSGGIGHMHPAGHMHK